MCILARVEALEGRRMLAGSTVLHSFAGRPGDGSVPQTGVVMVGSKLYGVTQSGGAHDDGSGPGAGLGHKGGTIYSVNVDGSGYQMLHEFGGTLSGGVADGYEPLAGLTELNGKLFGTTPFGGPGGSGALYSINLDGSGYELIHAFGVTADPLHKFDDGVNPFYAPLVALGGRLYGIVTAGGRPLASGGGNGVLFAIDPDGTDYTKVHVFDFGPNVALYDQGFVTNGTTFFGITSAGGPANSGTIWSVGVDGSNFKILHAMNGNSDGSSPKGSPTLATDTTLAGVAMVAGASGQGTLFTINTDGSGFATKQSFSTLVNGGFPQGDLLKVGDKLFGTTSLGGAGFPMISPVGSIYSTNLDGSGFETVYTFNGLVVGGKKEPQSPYGRMVTDGTLLYGASGNGGVNGIGTVFSVPLNAGGGSSDSPVINVSELGVPITNNQSPIIDFGSVARGQIVGPMKIFTVANAGATVLKLGAVQLPAGYRMVEGLVSSLAPGASDTFMVMLDPGAAGTYRGRLVIPSNDSGLSNSMFAFTVTGRVTGSGGGLADLTVKTAGKVPGKLLAGTTKGSLTLTVSNKGKVASSVLGTSVRLLLSENATPDAADVVLGTYKVSGALKAGGAKSVTASFKVPAGTPAANYRVLAVVDPEGTVAESNEGNNVATAGSASLAQPLVDLTGSFARVAAQAGKKSTLSLVLRNKGNVAATKFNVPLRVVLSRDGVFDGVGEQVLFNGRRRVTVGVGGKVTLPLALAAVGVPKGTFAVRVLIDPDEVTGEGNRVNNVVAGSIRVT